MTAYRTREARAETIDTLLNDLGMAIVTPVRKALSEHHETDYIVATANSNPKTIASEVYGRGLHCSGRKGVQLEDFLGCHPS